MSQAVLDIDIYSDVICPWCYIGKRRLDTVLAGELGENVQLRWRAFQLYPDIPAQGIDRKVLLQRRYGDAADPSRVPQRIAEEASSEGIELAFDKMRTTPNTLLAHRLLEFAYSKGVQHELAEALFAGYFCQGLDVGDIQTLADIAASLGLDKGEVIEYLHSDAGEQEVRTQIGLAPELGISGVPGFYLAKSFLLPGAQTSETMAQIIARVKSRILDRASGDSASA